MGVLRLTRISLLMFTVSVCLGAIFAALFLRQNPLRSNVSPFKKFLEAPHEESYAKFLNARNLKQMNEGDDRSTLPVDNAVVSVLANMFLHWAWLQGTPGVAQHQGVVTYAVCPESAWLDTFFILAPKLTSHACALRVCSPPAAIAVTQAISQTLICKALRIDSPPHAQMNKQRHKTWSFCLKYHILSKSNKI